MDFVNIKNGIIQLIKKAETELPNDVITALKKAYIIDGSVDLLFKYEVNKYNIIFYYLYYFIDCYSNIL